MAAYDAVTMTNTLLSRKFGLRDVNLKTQDIEAMATLFMRLEMFQILSKNAALSPRAKRELMRRVVAKFFPVRDGPPSSPQRSPPFHREERLADIQSIINSELRHAYGPKK